MKTLFLSAFAALALVTAPAFADEAYEGFTDGTVSANVSPEADAAAYTCQLRGAISGLKIGFVIDGQVLGGDAVIRCNDRGHHTVEVPVHVSVLGGGVGFDFTIVQRANLLTAGIGAVRNPNDLLGEYSLAASAGVTLINRGYNIQSAVSVKKKGHGVGFEVGFQGEKAIGLGARLDGLVMVVERR